jgi:aminoglycoside phosphotransferase
MSVKNSMAANSSGLDPKTPPVEKFEELFRDELWTGVGRRICRETGIQCHQIVLSEQGENIVLLIDEDLVVKIYKPSRRGFPREKAALEFANGKTSLPLPQIVHSGRIDDYDYLITSQIRGALMTRDTWLQLGKSEQIEILVQLASGLRELHSRNPSEIEYDWNAFLSSQIETVVDRQRAAGASPDWLDRLPDYLEYRLPLLYVKRSDVFLHGDVHFGNLRFAKTNGRLRISGIFDFSDSLRGHYEYEFVAPGVLMIQGQGDLQRAFFQAYGYSDGDIGEELRRRLMLLTILYECSSLKKYALRLKPEAVNFSLEELERAIWNFV